MKRKMKKTAAYFALIIFASLTALPFSLASAQSLNMATPPATQQLIPLSINATAIPTLTAVPSLNAVPLTAEAPPKNPAGTQETTQEATGTSSKGRTTDTATQETAQITYPDAELPVLDLGSTEEETQTQETSALCPATDTNACLDPAKAEQTILPPVIGNQVKISLLVFLGASLGTILWLLSNLFINSARGRRETLRLERQDRLGKNNLRLDNLGQAYGPVSNALDHLLKPAGKGLILDTKALADYKSAATNIELFGSEETLDAHKKLTGLLNGPKSPSAEEIESAKTGLMAALRKDLGLGPK